MGVYIPDIEMPKRHTYVTITIWSSGTASYGLFDREGISDFKGIKAVPVPPHGDLIDRDVLLDTATIHWSQTTNESCFPIDEIEYAPTVIPASKEAEYERQRKPSRPLHIGWY